MITKNTKGNAAEVSIVCMDDLVPSNHLVRKIDKSIDFNFIYDLVKDMYSNEIGRPSIDPVVLFKIIFIQYLFGIRSMRQTIEEIKVNMAYRWFLGLGFNDEVPHHSTFNKNYERRFKDSNVFSDIFSHILSQAYKLGFINDKDVYVDSTHIKANANKNKKEKIIVSEELSKYTKQLHDEINQNRKSDGKIEFDYEDTVEAEKTISKTDPESGYYVKGEKERCFAYSAQTACDNNGFVLGSVVVPGNVHDSASFMPLYEKTLQNNDNIENIVADAAYKTPVIAKTVQDDNKNLYAPYMRPKTKEGYFKKYEYQYNEERDYYSCPMGVVLEYKTTNRNGYREYRSEKNVCKSCPHKNQCTLSSTKTLTRHIHQKHVDLVEAKRKTQEFKIIYSKRKETIERVFADTKYKNNLGITNWRGLSKNQNRVTLLFACHNLKKMATWMSRIGINKENLSVFLYKILCLIKKTKLSTIFQ